MLVISTRGKCSLIKKDNVISQCQMVGNMESQWNYRRSCIMVQSMRIRETFFRPLSLNFLSNVYDLLIEVLGDENRHTHTHKIVGQVGR